MMRTLLASLAVFAVLFGLEGTARSQKSENDKFEDFDKLTKGAKVHEGLLRLYEKDEHVYAEIPLNLLNKPLLCPIAIARGLGLGGHTLNFDEQWVLLFQREGDAIHVVRRNVHFRAKKDSPASRAVETTYTDSVLESIKIRSIQPIRRGIIIDLNDLFMQDFAQLGLGSFDASRSTWFKVKAFAKNVELQVKATYTGRGPGDDSVIDDRGRTVVVHYGLVQLPEDGYQSRMADDRVGYFLTAVKDYTSDSKETSFQRYVNRWRLERADNDKDLSKLSPPKKKIVFWIENSVPVEYRKHVREGILEWNKAFEKIGFLDAIEVRQQEDEDFDPEDINYNTFRWITNDRGYAMGPSRANPLTGEILDADIVFDADMVRYLKHQYRLYLTGNGEVEPVLEPTSMIEASRKGWALPQPSLLQQKGWNDRAQLNDKDPRSLFAEAKHHMWAIQNGICQCGAHRRMELGLAAVALAVRAEAKDGVDNAIEEMIGQAIKETVMHEVGHTLGLRHNFKASTMLKADDLHNVALTRKVGVSGSVMDYNPVNLAPKGVKQGDYFSTTIGPYDYWAIEYGYKPLSGGTDGEGKELAKIAAKGALPGHHYGTDEDLFTTDDPLTNVWDLGDDPMRFARERMAISQELLKDLSDKVVEKGAGYQRVRLSFVRLLGQYGNSAHLVANHVGGQLVSRDHFGDEKGRDPIVAVSPAKQREALKFLEENILTDKPFQFAPQLLRRLAADRWLHCGNEMSMMAGVEFPLHERILGIQSVALNHLFNPVVLKRIQNNALKADEGDKPLELAEVFRSTTNAVWSDLPVKPEGKQPVASSVVRRNLQREHVKKLTGLVLGPTPSATGFVSVRAQAPPDARSLARLHLSEIQKRIEAALKSSPKMDDTVRAHLEETQLRIEKVLSASIQVREP